MFIVLALTGLTTTPVATTDTQALIVSAIVICFVSFRKCDNILNNNKIMFRYLFYLYIKFVKIIVLLSKNNRKLNLS